MDSWLFARDVICEPGREEALEPGREFEADRGRDDIESVTGCFAVDDFESLPFSPPIEYFVGTESERSDLVIFIIASPSRRVMLC